MPYNFQKPNQQGHSSKLNRSDSPLRNHQDLRQDRLLSMLTKLESYQDEHPFLQALKERLARLARLYRQ